jgi:hypothetical protein
MTLNPETQIYETPPPRWFNKDTGEYENIKPIYLLDPNNPSLGIVSTSRISREDDAFRRFIEDKEAKRQATIERERLQAKQGRLKGVNSPSSPTNADPTKRKSKSAINGFDEELAQKSYREATGKMVSKREATQVMGPSTTKEEKMKRELKQRYEALKPFATQDADLEKLPCAVNTEEIINAWKNSAAIIAKPKKKAVKSEGERVRTLVRYKSGRRGWSFAAMRGSYRPPNTIENDPYGGGWVDRMPPTLIGKEEELSAKRLRGWLKPDQLQNTAWWETKSPPNQWKSRSAIRKEQGRLAINPVTGKLEDIAPSKMEFKSVGNVGEPGT